MFDFLSWGHVLVIALAALFIFGPERLPTLTGDAARGLRCMRDGIAAVRADLAESLGDDFAELREVDLRRYQPSTFLRAQLFGENAARPSSGLLTGDRVAGAGPRESSKEGRDSGGTAGTALPAWTHVLPPPFDPDAT